MSDVSLLSEVKRKSDLGAVKSALDPGADIGWANVETSRPANVRRVDNVGSFARSCCERPNSQRTALQLSRAGCPWRRSRCDLRQNLSEACDDRAAEAIVHANPDNVVGEAGIEQAVEAGGLSDGCSEVAEHG